MRVDFSGYWAEKLPSGAIRHRVRVQGETRRKIVIPVGPDHPDFGNHYWAARNGEKWVPAKAAEPIKRSLEWLVARYLDHLERQVAAGIRSPLTLRTRRSILRRMCEIRDDDGDRYGGNDVEAPSSAWVKARDAWAHTPAEADNMVKAVRAMYEWALERGEVEVNPVKGVKKIHVSRGGAVPWSVDDLKAFKDRHAPGTMAHLWLTLEAFTACRIDDARRLGRANEQVRAGRVWLVWQPGKKGSAPVEIPMLPPLVKATRAQKLVGSTYLLTAHGRPFASAKALGNRVAKWCEEAGLTDRSSHGIRKAVGELLAEMGCTEYMVMSIMAHTQAQTSAIYTKGARRRVLAGDAMALLESVEW
jgi:integrase